MPNATTKVKDYDAHVSEAYLNRELKKLGELTASVTTPVEEVNEEETMETPNPYEEHFHSEFSFISFVLGIFGLILPLFSVFAIVFGIAGLMQTHRERMKGKWMAVTGISLGFLGIVIIIVAIAFGISFLESYLMRYGGIESLMGQL